MFIHSIMSFLSVGDDVLAYCFAYLFHYVPYNAVAQRVRLVCHEFDRIVRCRGPSSWARLLGPSRLAEVTAQNVSELQLRLRPTDEITPSELRAPPALTRLALMVCTKHISGLASWLNGASPPPTGLVALHLCISGYTMPAVDDLAQLLRPVAAQLDDLVIEGDHGGYPMLAPAGERRRFVADFVPVSGVETLFAELAAAQAPRVVRWFPTTPPATLTPDVLAVCQLDAPHVVPPRRRIEIVPHYAIHLEALGSTMRILAQPEWASLVEWDVTCEASAHLASELEAMLMARRQFAPPTATTALKLCVRSNGGMPPPTPVLPRGSVTSLDISGFGFQDHIPSDWIRWIAQMGAQRLSLCNLPPGIIA